MGTLSRIRSWLQIVRGAASSMVSADAAAAAMPELHAGDAAPEFSLPGSDGKIHALADSRGARAVVLAWFPKTFTGGCTIECQSLRDSGALLRDYDVAYYMISCDTLDDNTRFAKEHDADYPILSDVTKEIAMRYGVIGRGGFPRRWTFYIAADGTVARIDKAVKPASSGADIVATLGELKIARRK